MVFNPTHSPLYMAMHDPVLYRFVEYLTQQKEEQERNPDTAITLEFERSFITSVRDAFRQKILDGEKHLHQLAHLIASALLEGRCELHSNVIGMLPGDGERPFLIRERISADKLLNVLDIDLGNQMLDNFRYRQGRSWVPLELSANFIEYLPLGRHFTGVNRLTSRVKAEEELWNKVTDEIFQLNQLVSRDKHLNRFSKYVKDIFGLKIVCDDDNACLEVHKKLVSLTVDSVPQENNTAPHQLFIAEQERTGSDKLLEFLETKDYLTCPESEMKKTGWKALKSVVKWSDRMFEIQVQPLSNYYLELDHMAGPSHQSFKIQRDIMREEVAERVPLYGFYRKLLRQLFKDSEDVSFKCDHASIHIKD
ncbi:MAG: hypothetical protein K2W95_28560 [Candidatus Obscuribacterales bacterium]|nr:hypothetical protein [Candidatus Obscuribacterales bacterium]